MSETLSTVANPNLVKALCRRDRAQVQAALPGSTLLVPAAGTLDGEVAVDTRRGARGRRLVCAFTDLEALQAWDRNPPGAAVALDAVAVAELVPDGMIALNPAGPGALLLDDLAFTNSHAHPVVSDSGVPAISDAADLADPRQRLVLRRRANQFHELARRSAAAGEISLACEQLQQTRNACEQLGDQLHGAAATLELAAWRARSGSTRLAVGAWREAAQTLAALGELDLALDALLDAATTAADAGLAEHAEALSVAALDLAAGTDFSDRLIGLWRRLPIMRPAGGQS